MSKSPTEPLLIDTDVLIDYLRGRDEAVELLENSVARLLTSAICVAELFAGVRGAREQSALETFLQAIEIVPVDTEIAAAGGLHRRNPGPSHGTGLADALIAASAEAESACLVTRNRKHFPMLEHVLVPYGPRSSTTS